MNVLKVLFNNPSSVHDNNNNVLTNVFSLKYFEIAVILSVETSEF